jgi:iron complex outermembrane recepter protein
MNDRSNSLPSGCDHSSHSLRRKSFVGVVPWLVFLLGFPSLDWAQADQSIDEPQATQGNQVAQGSTPELQEVVVTGTHIIGVSPASPLIVLTSTDIANSGFTTTGDVLRNLPQSFAGGQQSTIGTNGFGPSQNTSNFNNSDSANLRGLGSDSTLVLINGLRAQVTGIQDSVNISAIPLVAIDRIEVVTDGASALYGSDAVGGVVNFILKKDYSGAETSAEVEHPTGAGGLSQQYGQLLGTTWESGSAMLAYQYRNQDGVYGAQRGWWTGPNPESLIPAIHQNSAYLSVSQTATPDLTFFAQGLYNRLTSYSLSTQVGPDAPTDYFNDVGYSYLGVVGASLILPREWELTATGDVGADRFDHSDIEPCCNLNSPLIPTNRLALGELEAQGPLVELPSGELRAALGSGYRRETLDVEGIVSTSSARHLRYSYGELAVPLVGKETARSGVQELTLSVAGRYEDYSDVGGHFSPEVGLAFKPISTLRLRTTWNRSFHAPSLYDKYSPYRALVNYPVEAPGGGTADAVVTTGGNASLVPETARSYTLGFDWKPTDKLRVNGTYFNTAYSDVITEPIVDLSPALLDPQLAPLITLNPSVPAQEAVINGASAVYDISGKPFIPGQTAALIDDRHANVASQTATGGDLLASYRVEVSAGLFTPFFNGSVLSLRQRLTNASAVQTISGLVFYPPRFKLQGGLSWQRRELGGTATFNYTAAETDNLGEPETRIGAWYTLDLQARYVLPVSSGPVSGLSVRLSAINVFDKDPPIVSGYADIYDNAQASPYGRILKLDIAKQW